MRHPPSSGYAYTVVGTLWFAVVPEASEQRLDSHQAVLHAYIFQRILGSDVDRTYYQFYKVEEAS
jgi:hypothetical protein